MIQAVPLSRLDPSFPLFLFDHGIGSVGVGIVEYMAAGYAKVCYLLGKGKAREFVDRDGEAHSFEGSGFVTSEWSTGTLVRPISKEEDMSDVVSSALVADAGEPVAEVRRKVVKLQERVKSKTSASVKGKGKAPKPAKKEKAPKAANPCTCSCGGTTGGRFVPGHDARFYGWLQKVADGRMEFKELPKPVQKALVDVKGARKELASHRAKKH